jgi:exonuclease SbcD
MGFTFGHIADIHLGNYQGKVEAGGFNSRFLDFVKTYNQSIDEMIEAKVDFALVVGDIFRSKNPTPEEINEFAKGIMKLQDADIPIIVTLGNHDLFLADNKTHAIGVIETLLNRNDNFIISREPEIIKLKIRDEEVQILSFPYPIRSLLRLENSREVEAYVEDKVAELYDARDPKVPMVFAGHFTLRDCVVGDEQRYVDKFAEPLIPGSIFKDRDFIYGAMGHIHTFQVVYKKPLVIYPGSNNRVDFNEVKEDKGFCLVKYADGKTAYKFKKVDARVFVDLKYDLSEEDDPQKVIIEDLEGRALDLKDAIVRLGVILSEENKNKYDVKKVTEIIEKSAYWIHGLPIPSIKRKDEGRSNAGFTESMDAIQSLNHYAKTHNVLKRKKFLEIGEKIIKTINGGKENDM